MFTIKKFFLCFILIKILFVNCKKIVIPFKTVNTGDSNYIKSLLQNQIYTELQIGTTKQTVYVAISTETYYFSIESYLINETFYSDRKSNSFKNNTSYFYYNSNERMKKGYILNETFYFKDYVDTNQNYKAYNNVMFNYITELSKGSSGLDNGYIDNNKTLLSGVIGLQISNNYLERDEIYFIKSLKQIDSIDKIIWNINYINDNEGYLIFGEYPHQYNDDFQEKDMKKTNCITFEYRFYWFFIFTDIRIGNNKMTLYRMGEYAPQLGVIIGTNEYFDLIKNYFQSKDRINKCVLNETIFKQIKYSYYECEKSVDIDDFEPIIFIHRELVYNFTLDKNDLFIDFNNKKYFLVIFKKSVNVNRWTLGRPFVKKYNFAFDHDNKLILFYEKSKKDNKFDKKILLYILIIFLGICVLGLGIFIGRQLYGKKKKIKANEMEDNQESINNGENDSNSDYNKMGLN
jgi:hypothetical protein